MKSDARHEGCSHGTIQEHREYHKHADRRLRELVEDWMTETNGSIHSGSVCDLLDWSRKQTENPDDRRGLYHEHQLMPDGSGRTIREVCAEACAEPDPSWDEAFIKAAIEAVAKDQQTTP